MSNYDNGYARAAAMYDAMEPPTSPECPNCDGPLYVEQDRDSYDAVCERDVACDACTMGSGPVVVGTGLWLEPDGDLGRCWCDCREDADCKNGAHVGCGYRFHTERDVD